METLVIKTLEFLKGQSIQVAIVFIAVLILTWLLQNKSAHIRYLLWLLVAIKCLTPPLVIFSVPVLPAQTISVVTQAQSVEIDNQPTQNTVITITPEQVQSQAPIESRPVGSPSKIENSLSTRVHLTPTGVLLSAWAAGAAFYLLWALGKAVRLEMQLRRIRKPLPAQLMIEQIETLIALWNYPGSFKVWLVDGINQPFVWGLWRGAIYLPTRFQNIQGDKQKAIVLHEMAHVVRFDAFVNLIQILIQGVFWFHPLVWLANRAIRQEREKCCDEIAVARLGTAPKEYGHAIVDTLLQEAEAGLAIPTLAVAGPVKNIEDRIKTIMQPGRRFFHRPSTIALLIIGVLAAFVIPTTIALTQKVTPPDYTLSGTVTDAQTEKPIAGAIVFDDGYGPQPYQKGITDESGKFEYKSWNEEHNVAAKADGYLPQMTTFTTFPFDNSKNLNLKLSKSSDQQMSAIRIMMEMIAVPNEEQQLQSLFEQAGLKVPQFAMAGIQGINPQAGQEKLSYGQYLFLSSQDRDNIIKATQSNPQISLLTSPQVVVASGEEATMEVSTSPNLPKRVSSFKIKPSITKDSISAEFNILYLNTIGTQDDPDSRIVSKTIIQSNILIPNNKTLLMISPETFKDQKNDQKPPQRLLFLVKTEAETLHDEPEPAQTHLPSNGRMPGGMGGGFAPVASLPFTAVLPDGVTVELLGLCEHPSEGKQWWKPNGSDLKDKPWDKMRHSVSAGEGRKAYEIALKLNWPKNNTPGFYVHIDLTGSRCSSSQNNLNVEIVDLPNNLETTDIHFAVASGSWQTRAAQQSPWDGVYVTGVVWQTPIAQGNKTILSVAHNFTGDEYRLVAIDKNGKEIVGHGESGSIDKNTTNMQMTFNVKLDNIKEFQLQTRPYEHYTFKNVSLKPGQKTDVKVETSEPKNKTGQEQPKAMEIFDNPKFKKRFHITIVVDKNNEISGDGQKVTFEQLDAMMPQFPEPANTVLEVAFEPGAFPDIHTRHQDNPVFQKAGQLVDKYHLEYLSYVGEDHPESRRGPLSIRTEGTFEIDKVIAVGMPAVDLNADKPLLTVNTIVFSSNYSNVLADMSMAVISPPKRQWEIKVRLLDKDGRQIDSIVHTYQKSGVIMGVAAITNETLMFNFGTLDLSKIAKFEIEVRQIQLSSLMPDQKADSKIELPAASMQERLDAMNHARQAAVACITYASDNSGKLPDTLEQIKPYLPQDNPLPLDKMELLQAGRIIGEIKRVPTTALLRMQLNDGKNGAIVAYCDGHAEYFSPERMKTSAYPDAAVASTLEFRVVPEIGKDINESDLQKYKELLQTQGPAADCNGYKWIAAGTTEKASWYDTLPNQRYKDAAYVLLCDQPDKRMLADGRWGLEKVSVEATTNLHTPTILAEFDDAGASLFGQLTKQNIGRQIAIIIDGKFFSAPRVQTMVSKQAAITGNFTNEEIGNLVKTLIQGMPPLGAKQNLQKPLSSLPIPSGANQRVTNALQAISDLMVSLDAADQKGQTLSVDVFNQINEQCDNLQGKNGTEMPNVAEWGKLPSRLIDILELLHKIEETAEGCRSLSQGDYPDMLKQHWQTLREYYNQLSMFLTPRSNTL